MISKYIVRVFILCLLLLIGCKGAAANRTEPVSGKADTVYQRIVHAKTPVWYIGYEILDWDVKGKKFPDLTK